MMSSVEILTRLGIAISAIAFATSAVGCSTATEEEVADTAGDDNDNVLRASLETRPGDTELDAFSRRAEWIDTYGSIPAGCVNRHDALHGTHAIFHGCYDWHSSVHAHWAVYRMDLSGTGTRRNHADAIDARFVEADIARVATELDADAGFENPYGRAWLLHLAADHERWNTERRGEASRRLRGLGDRVAQAFVDEIAKRAPDPRRADYQSDAWMLAQLLLYGRATSQPAFETAAASAIRDRFQKGGVLRWSETNDADPSSFMSTFWSSVYAIALATDARTTLDAIDPASLPDEAITPVPDPGVATDVHHLGINWSRAWAIKALARHAKTALGDGSETTKRLVRAYHAHVLAGRERHFRYRGNYFAYDHWVPQFAVYAITD
jgi:DUF2891 family protein